jgi:uncharacterized integral membrane protein
MPTTGSLLGDVMSVLNRTRRAPAEPGTGLPPLARAGPPSASPAGRVPHTRMRAAWLGISAASLTSVVLIVFMLQNTRSVEITFLSMHGTLPLALALLIAAVGVGILFTVIGTARITQLRRRVLRERI